ncbi:MAG: F0F1 ATP synthase subunit C [Proteobacteria bacterium]|nr:F0F1 ATP synthase subunit C [Pseudomonadota bacterium]
MDLASAKMIGTGLAIIALIGPGVGIGHVFANLVSSLARNPSAKNDIFGVALLGFALTESIALLAFVVAMIILFS